MNILVVDDEYFARKAIIKIILTWNQDANVAEAETGLKALSYITEKAPDIVITDIRMPKMDGIELAKHLYHSYHFIRVIIVSGYEDFKYAQSALKFNVKDYLLKPLKKLELINALNKLFEEIQIKDREKIQRDIVENIETFNQITDSKSVFEFYNELHGIGKNIITAVLQTMDDTSAELKDWFIEKTADSFQMRPFILANHLKGNEWVFVFHECYVNQVKKLLQELIKEFLGSFDTDISVGLSGLQATNHMDKSYTEAEHALNYRLIDGWNKVYDYNGIQNYVGCPVNIDTNMGNILYENLVQGRAVEAVEMMGNLLSPNVFRLPVSLYNLQELIYRIVCIVNEAIKEYNLTISDVTTSRFYRETDLSNYKCFDHLKGNVESMIYAVCSLFTKTKSNGVSHVIRGILHHIEQYYYEDLSLKKFASNDFFMNSSYVSRLFKSEVGMNFSNYVIQVRMNKAKEIMMFSHKSIMEVAQMVGFNDPSYFIRLFKSKYGLTPNQFKKQFRID